MVRRIALFEQLGGEIRVTIFVKKVSNLPTLNAEP
jgi:hypothetical protein